MANVAERSNSVGGWLMKAVAVAVAVTLLASSWMACDGDLVTSTIDAGSVVDAGFPDADSGVVDAGFIDADAGFVDAGRACEPQPTPEIEWTCEDDVDWCDPVNDFPAEQFARMPSADLVGVWSRMEGDDVIIEARFRAFPLRADVYQSFVVLFIEPNAPHRAHEMSRDFSEPPLGPGARYGVTQPPLYFFPPPDSSYSSDFENFAPDACRYSVSLSAPVIRLQIPRAVVARADSSVRFGVISAGEVLPPRDVSWPDGSPTPLGIGGGAADDAEPFARLCDLTCDLDGDAR